MGKSTWILPGTSRADDIQFYLEIVLAGMMFWYYLSKNNSEEPILKRDFTDFCVVG